jgi:hypothetical protein
MAAAYLAPAAAREIFGDPRAILAWGPGPAASAVAVEGGYRISGTWEFASGGRHATLLDVWHVVALRVTGSDSFTVAELFVPLQHSLAPDDPRERREPGPLYCFPIGSLYASGFAGVALGVARSTLEAFVALARDKTPRGLRERLRDSAAIQSQVPGRGVARVGAHVPAGVARRNLAHEMRLVGKARRQGQLSQRHLDRQPAPRERVVCRFAGPLRYLANVRLAKATVAPVAGSVSRSPTT